jgi:hypothetical protein
MIPADLRKWLAFGTGVGIEIGREDLNITVARVRPGGAAILGELSIQGFREKPASEWGALYANFLKRLHLGHLAATVLLPREESIVRYVSLPGVSDRDLAAAIRFELDALQPYADGDTIHDWARIGRTSTVLVGIARRAPMDKYAALLAEAGVKISAFTISAAAIYSALRLLSRPPAGGLLAIAEQTGELEVYGESPSRPVFSACLNESIERAAALSIAELRLPQETVPVSLSELLPKPRVAPAGVDLSRTALPYATALAGACPQLALSVNLLPPEQRRTASRLRYVPTAALAFVVLLMALASLAYPSFADRRYLGLVQTEVRKLEPRANGAATLDRVVATSRNRSQVLDNFRRQTKQDIDALNELTQILRSPTWLTSLQLTRDSIAMFGQTDQAAPLLKTLDGSHQFKESGFTLPIARLATGETFSIRGAREAGAQ